MKNYKQILEAINKGIQLALDDFEDIDNNSISQTNDIIDVEDVITLQKEYKIFKKYIDNVFKHTLKPLDICKLRDLSKTYGFKWRFYDRLELKNTIDYITTVDDWANLNWMDVSNIFDMNQLFRSSIFNGDISEWDVSCVNNMWGMFKESKFNGDISKWNVSNVNDMQYMFEKSKFNGDISNWNVSRCINMRMMFKGSQFNQDISKWDVSNVTNMEEMFRGAKFNQPIGNWKINTKIGNSLNMDYMFKSSKFNQDISNWKINTFYTYGMFDGCNIEEQFKPKNIYKN